MKPATDQSIAFWLNIVLLDIAVQVLLTALVGEVLRPRWMYLAFFAGAFPLCYYALDLINYVRFLRAKDPD